MNLPTPPIRLWLALGAALLVGPGLFAQAVKPSRLSPSPDGRYVLVRGDTAAGQAPLDLTDKATGQVLQHIVPQSPDPVSIEHILWKPDASAFAVAIGTGLFDWNVTVYFRRGDTFESMQFPEMPRATIPAKYGPDTKLTHWDDVNAQKPVAWLPDGSLVVEITSAADDSHTTVTATRSVTIRFPAKGQPQLSGAPVKVTTRKE